MLEELRIKNYKSHHDTVIKFRDKLNVIVGSSDAGKSTIHKAIDLLYRNKVTKNYLTHGKKQAEVTSVENNKEYKRIKSKVKNLLFVDGEKYEAFGQQVPEPIKELKYNDINFLKQSDSHFLISDTAGEVAKKLNEVVDISIIDKSLMLITRDKKALLKNIEQQAIELEQKQKRKDEIGDFKKQKRRLSKMKTLQRQIETVKSDVSEVEEILCDIDEIESKRHHLYHTLLLGPLLNKINETESELEELQEIDRLQTKIEKLVATQNKNKIREGVLEVYNELKKMEEVEILKGLIDKKKKANKRMEELNKKLPELCPICNNALGGEKWNYY
ncbi:MAG: AAA family ATPase [Mycoplasma sp.]|nr:AAA family ATPase [Mycoplasma sp.]